VCSAVVERDGMGEAKCDLVRSHLAYRLLSLFVAGIAIDKDGVVYFADGANIRAVDETRNIRTVIGSQAAPKHWTPFPCRTVLNVSQVRWCLSRVCMR